VDIFYKALQEGSYECFLRPDSALPMMYMPDCLKATVDLLEAPVEKLKQRVYNVTAMSFTPEQLAKAIAKRIPNFKVTYNPDFRQPIADSWPRSLNDSNARADWGWKHQYDLDAMVDGKRISEIISHNYCYLVNMNYLGLMVWSMKILRVASALVMLFLMVVHQTCWPSCA
jgi:threonine 3-dehydrogenase